MLRRVSQSRRKQSIKDRMKKESPEDYGTPYKSSADWSPANLEDIQQTEAYSEDYNGDEDFYGDDEENQSGNTAYSDDQRYYVGRGNWVDERYGENQYSRNHDPQNPNHDDGIRPERRFANRRPVSRLKRR